MDQLSTTAKIVNHDKRPSMKNHELVRSFGAFEIQKIGRKYIHTLSLAPNTNPNYITYLIINPLCSSLKVGDLALCEVVDRSEKNKFGTNVILEPIRLLGLESDGVNSFHNIEYAKLLMKISLEYVSKGWFSGFVLESTAKLCLLDQYKNEHHSFYCHLQECRLNNALRKYIENKDKRLHDVPDLPETMNYINDLYNQSVSNGFTPSGRLKNKMSAFSTKYKSLQNAIKKINKREKVQPKFEYIDHSDEARIKAIEEFTSNEKERKHLKSNLMNGCLLYIQNDELLLSAVVKMKIINNMGKNFHDVEKYKYFLRTFTGKKSRLPTFKPNDCKYIVNCFFSLGILQNKNGRLISKYPNLEEVQKLLNKQKKTLNQSCHAELDGIEQVT